MTKSIEQVFNENPELHSLGWLVEGQEEKLKWKPNLDEVDLAMRFIQEHAVPRRVSSRSQGSYGLKHAVERWAGTYISNGAFIAAALALGYEARRFPNSPNCAFNLVVPDRFMPWGQRT